MKIENIISVTTINAIQNLYSSEVNANSIQLQQTKKEFEGDITLVVFPFVKIFLI